MNMAVPVICPSCKVEFQHSFFTEDNFYNCPHCRFSWNYFDTGRRITLKGFFPDGRQVNKVLRDFEKEKEDKVK